MEYIEINKEDVPYSFDIQLNNETYTFTINYNTNYNYFTIDLIKNDIDEIVIGEKVIYGFPLFRNVIYKDIPPINIVPYDLNQEDTRVGYDELNESIFLYIEDDSDEAME